MLKKLRENGVETAITPKRSKKQLNNLIKHHNITIASKHHLNYYKQRYNIIPQRTPNNHFHIRSTKTEKKTMRIGAKTTIVMLLKEPPKEAKTYNKIGRTLEYTNNT